VRSAAARVAVVAILLACGCTLPGLLAGCGSAGPHLPHVTVGVFLGPRPRQATIDLRSTGSGSGVASIVFTYPNGHRRDIGEAVVEDGLGTGNGPEQLPRGRYKYTVYAVATASAPMAPTFPANGHVAKNIIASGTFVID
jgi:hypothetical protein